MMDTNLTLGYCPTAIGPFNVINVWGGMHGSQIQDTAQSSQVLHSSSAVNWEEPRNILADLRTEPKRAFLISQEGPFLLVGMTGFEPAAP